jgi:polyhydroxyalkanoate synthesis regulator phasin
VADEALLKSLTKVARSLEDAIRILRGKSPTTTSSTSAASSVDIFSERDLESQIDLMNKLNESLEHQKGIVRDNLSEYELLQQQYEETADTLRSEFYQQLRDLNDQLEAGTITAQEHAEAVQEVNKSTKAAAEANYDLKNSNEDLENSAHGLIKTFTGLDKNVKSMTGKLLFAADGFKTLKGTLEKYKDPQVIFNSVTAKMEESTVRMVKRTDEAFASFNRLTGAGGSLNQTMFDAQYEARALGVTVESAAAATGVLYTQMSNFTELAPNVQKELIKSAASMEALGISSETTAGLMDVSMNSLRMSQDEAKALSDDLAKLSIGLGKPPAELAEGFRKALPTLAAYGKGARKVFEGLAAAAKATSISTQELLGIFGESMDTFEGSAQAAGKLNALLGGNLVNSMELLYATEDERIQIVKQAMDATGRNFDMLDKYEKKAIAAAVGISDMTTATKLFGTSSEQVDHYTNTLDAMGISQEELVKRQQAGLTLMQKLGAIFDGMSFFVLGATEFLNGFLDAILRLDKDLGGKLIPGFALLTTAVSGLLSMKMTGWMLKFVGLANPVSLVATKFVGAFSAMATAASTAFSGIAASASAAAGPILAALSPILLVVGAIAGGLLLAKGIGSALGMDMSMENIAGSFMNAGGAVKDFFTFGNDVIMRPGEKPIMLNKDDIVLAGTNLLGEQAARNTGVVNNATYNTSNVSNTTQTAAPSVPMKERDLVIQINGREIGRVAADYIRKEYSLVNNSGY